MTMDKEPLRQCRECKRSFHIQDLDTYINDYEPRTYWYKCRYCQVKEWNMEKKLAGDKTEFVLIEKPRGWKLGSLMTDAYRWNTESSKHWTIWDQDVEDIQKIINTII